MAAMVVLIAAVEAFGHGHVPMTGRGAVFEQHMRQMGRPYAGGLHERSLQARLHMGMAKDPPQPQTSLLQLLEEKQLRLLVERAVSEPGSIVQLLRDAGFAGVVSYFIIFLAFYSFAVPVGEVGYHLVSGRWLDPRVPPRQR